MPRSRIRPSVRRSFSISRPARLAASTHAIQSSGSATSSDTTPISRAMFCIRSSSTSVVLSTTKLVPPNLLSSSPTSPASCVCSGCPVKTFFGAGAVSMAARCSFLLIVSTRASEPGMSQPEIRLERSIRAT